MNTKSNSEALREIIGRTWADPEFRSALIHDPRAHLAAAGLLEDRILNDPTISIAIVSSPEQALLSDRLYHFVIPERPDSGELSDEDLQRAEQANASGTAMCNTKMHTCCCDQTVAPILFE